MTTDEALAWARATENHRWRIVCGEGRDTRGAAYEHRHAQCVETLADAVEQLRREVAIRVRDNDALKAATTSGANYIQIGDVDSGAPTLTSGTAYCPECVRLKAELKATQEEWDKDHVELQHWREAALSIGATDGHGMALDFERLTAERDAAEKEIARMLAFGPTADLARVVAERDTLMRAINPVGFGLPNCTVESCVEIAKKMRSRETRLRTCDQETK